MRGNGLCAEEIEPTAGDTIPPKVEELSDYCLGQKVKEILNWTYYVPFFHLKVHIVTVNQRKGELHR